MMIVLLKCDTLLITDALYTLALSAEPYQCLGNDTLPCSVNTSERKKCMTFSSKSYLEKKTGAHGVGRLKYLQTLVTEFQDTHRQGNFLAYTQV